MSLGLIYSPQGLSDEEANVFILKPQPETARTATIIYRDPSVRGAAGPGAQMKTIHIPNRRRVGPKGCARALAAASPSCLKEIPSSSDDIGDFMFGDAFRRWPEEFSTLSLCFGQINNHI